MSRPRPAGATRVPSPQRLRRLAEGAALIGGRIVRAAYGRSYTVSLKRDGSEVTTIDLTAERGILACLRAQRPQDVFIAEERSTPNGRAAPGFWKQRPEARKAEAHLVWAIDPLDGTRNFIRGVPLFACSVAALQDGEPVAGAIYDPLRDVLYSAAAGHGAFANGRRLRLTQGASRRGNAADGVLAPRRRLIVAIPSVRCRMARGLVRRVLAQHVVRNLGTTALHLALVAEGGFDAAISNNSRLWDIAAGALLVIEAGGVISTPDGQALFPLDMRAYRGGPIPTLAGARAAHARLLRGA